MERPLPDEYESSYLKYYIDLVQGDDAVKALEALLQSTHKLLKLINEEQASYRYAEGKWLLKEVIGHMIDTERIFTYRALCISRGEQQSLPGYEENDYAAAANYKDRSISDIASEYKVVKEGSIAFFKSLNDEMLMRSGFANGNKINVKTILYALAGHETHHMNVIRTKYLS